MGVLAKLFLSIIYGASYRILTPHEPVPIKLPCPTAKYISLFIASNFLAGNLTILIRMRPLESSTLWSKTAQNGNSHLPQLHTWRSVALSQLNLPQCLRGTWKGMVVPLRLKDQPLKGLKLSLRMMALTNLSLSYTHCCLTTLQQTRYARYVVINIFSWSGLPIMLH